MPNKDNLQKLIVRFQLLHCLWMCKVAILKFKIHLSWLQSCSLWNKNHIHRKIDKMKRQKALYQMKEQDKTPEKQLNEVEIGNLPENPGTQKKNGGKDREDARKV